MVGLGARLGANAAARSCIDAIGGLDEGFVMYSEELDYCRRAKTAGWQVAYHGGAIITHHGGKSSEQVAAQTLIRFHTSKLRYFRKHHGNGHYLFLRACFAAAIRLAIGARSRQRRRGPQTRPAS